jgi:outer membrane receptor for ferrienterochelin and colicins
MKRPLLLLLFLFTYFFIHAQDTSKVNLAGMSLEDLMNIKVVSASGAAQTINDAPSTIRVITAQQIEERGYEHLADVLRDLEGVDLIHASGYLPNVIYFRGLYGAENLRTLLLIDGIRENTLTGSPELAGPAYSLHNVERIEIIWGPASALYGADAFGGVINMITKEGGEQNGLHYEKGFGTFNTSSENVSFGMKRKSLDVSFAGSLYSTDGPRYLNRSPFYTGSYVDRAWSVYGCIGYTYKKFKTTLCYRTFDTPMSFGLVLNSATKILNLPSQGYNNSGAIGILYEDIKDEKPSRYEPYTNTSSFKTEFSATEKLTLTGSFIFRETGLSDRSYVYLSIDTTLYDAAGNVNTAVDSTHIYRVPIFNYSNRTRGDLTATYALSANQDLLAGVQYSQDNLERGNRRSTQDTNKYVVNGIPIRNLRTSFLPRLFFIRNNFGSYLQYMLRTNFLRRTSFTAGVRYDQNTDYENPVSPRLGVVINPDPKYTVKLLYGTAFRSPTITEIAAAEQAFGTKAVNPEKVSTYEVNLIYQPSSKWMAQLNGFHNELSDIFVLNSLTGSGFGQKQTQGTAQVTGFEAHIDAVFTPQFSSFFNYTFQHGTQKDTKANSTFDIPNLPEMKANAGITYALADYLTVSAIANWVGERVLPHSNPYGIGRGYVMDGYFLGNLVLTTRKFLSNRISASINVQNVFNSSYLDPGIRTADGALYSTVLEQPGRTLLFKITVNL